MGKGRKGKGRHAMGPENGKWVGDAISYVGVHSWIKRTLGEPRMCQECGRTRQPKGMKKSYFEWANVSGKYLRVVGDWKRLCAKCHRIMDRHLVLGRKKSSRNTSGYKGVSWEKDKKKWGASVERNGKHIRLGRFATKEEAAQAVAKYRLTE